MVASTPHSAPDWPGARLHERCTAAPVQCKLCEALWREQCKSQSEHLRAAPWLPLRQTEGPRPDRVQAKISLILGETVTAFTTSQRNNMNVGKYFCNDQLLPRLWMYFSAFQLFAKPSVTVVRNEVKLTESSNWRKFCCWTSFWEAAQQDVLQLDILFHFQQ